MFSVDVNEGWIDMAEILRQVEGKSARNLKDKTYHYLAVHHTYHTAKNIDRTFLDLDTDLEAKASNFEVGKVYEMAANIRESVRYSIVQKAFFLVTEISNNEMTVDIYNTAKRAEMARVAWSKDNMTEVSIEDVKCSIEGTLSVISEFLKGREDSKKLKKDILKDIKALMEAA